ncbi:fasciclin domain-containing protein [Blastococcus sp. TF02A-30]|uniref:fasciclin domain-containing protein n=1 Tax=Blastococcus sp. TF02A-30 TaxID=2250580 RepID=UPI001F1B9FF2|nr:fasciclin domain-containing protein [Blastococcus sp. TF02A-30]
MTPNPLTRAVVAAALLVGLSACSDDDGGDGASASPSSAAPAPAEAGAAPVEEPFGPACTEMPAEGEGSIVGMADDPVGTAVVNNPLLTQLTAAVQTASLLEPLNGQPEVTVLAPVDAAFAAVPPGGLDPLDTARTTAVVLHHVIPGRLAPEALAGTHTTLNNDQVTIEGSGTGFSVPAAGTLAAAAPATVVCGFLQTANATVYLVDQVLAPVAAG